MVRERQRETETQRALRCHRYLQRGSLSILLSTDLYMIVGEIPQTSKDHLDTRNWEKNLQKS